MTEERNKLSEEALNEKDPRTDGFEYSHSLSKPHNAKMDKWLLNKDLILGTAMKIWSTGKPQSS